MAEVKSPIGPGRGGTKCSEGSEAGSALAIDEALLFRLAKED